MQKGDIITGQIEAVASETRTAKNGNAHTGVKVDGGWYRVWGDRTTLDRGEEVSLEVSWVAPEGEPVFCVLTGDGKPDKPSQVGNFEQRLAELERRVVVLEAKGDIDDGIPF